MPFRSGNITREVSDGGVKQTVTGERADGTAANSSHTAKYDGKDVPVTGNAPYDTIAFKQVNANTLTDERKKMGGSYKATGRTVISNGGKTMTMTQRWLDVTCIKDGVFVQIDFICAEKEFEARSKLARTMMTTFEWTTPAPTTKPAEEKK